MTSTRALVCLALLLCVPASASAQAEDDSPAFSLWSSQIFTTHDRPAFSLTFRRVEHLDFRVYRVEDPLRFFAGLRDPHQLGSLKPVVPQERTWLERIAAWKSSQRASVREFVRRQFSNSYRRAHREQQDTQQVSLRQTLQYNSFAQVPLLNATHLVASWRELLPPLRDAETRRIPLDVKSPGVYVIEAVNAPLRAYTIVMVSDIGLVTKTAPGQMFAYLADRYSGEPQAGCDVQTLVDRKVAATGTTGDDGTMVAALDAIRPDTVIAVARCGSQVTATDPGAWSFQDSPRELVGYVYTDKPIYRPAHVVRIKAVLRWRTRGLLTAFDRKQVEVAVADNNDKVVFRERRDVDAFGTVNVSVPLSKGAALGYYTVTVRSEDDSATGTFEVQEYRKPEFEVAVSSPDRFTIQGKPITATITARYYFGQPVAGGLVKYVVHRRQYNSPLRWRDDDEEMGGGGWYGGNQQSEQSARLDERGVAVVSIPTTRDENSRDYSLRIEARVTDASSREVSGSTTVHATFGRFLIATDTDRYVFGAGSPVTVSVKALDYAGVAQSGVAVTVMLEKLTYTEGRWSEPKVTEISRGQIQTDADGRATWIATLPADPGTYRFTATAPADDRTVEDQSQVWVTGSAINPSEEGDAYLELVADKKSYQPGETARLVVRGGSVTAPVLVTKEGQVVTYHRVARVKPDDAIEVPVVEDDRGDVYVNVLFLKDDRLFRAEKRLKVPATTRQLQVAVAADQAVSKPRQPGRFTLTVTDQSGAPVKAQLSVGVIDEAVYGVKADDTPDPLRFFYRRAYSRVSTDFSRGYSFVGYAGTQQLLLARHRRPLTLADFKGEREAKPEVRKEFPDAIFWVADLVTDDAGRATVQVPYPDALTTWRLTARAVTADTRVGAGIGRSVVTKDLILRVVTPRFLTEGDTVELPLVVHNYLQSDKSVALTANAAGLTPVGGADSQASLTQRTTLQVARGGEARLDWRFRADQVGSATVTGSATTDGDSDAVELSFPVLPFGLRREVGAAGSLIGAGEQSAELLVPESANPAARSIRVVLAPSLAGPIFGALDYLTSYPYGCTEQTLSSFVPNLVARRASESLHLPLTESMKSLDRQVTEGLGKLSDYQHQDGGWGWWKTDENHPFMTAYALYGLLEARANGYKVEDFTLSRGVGALRRLYMEYPRAVPELKAYEAYVLALAASRGVESHSAEETAKPYGQAAALDELSNARGRMSAYGQSLLLLTLDLVRDPRADAVATELASQVQRKGDLAWWKSDNDPLLEDFQDTSVEATAFAVRALAAHDPRSPLLDPALRWLLLNRTYGTYWSSTKQTAMVLFGLLEVMKVRGETAQPSDVEVFVNGVSLGSRTLKVSDPGRLAPVELDAPAAAGKNTVRLVKRGAGALYWSAQAVYFDPRAGVAPTGSRKLAVLRQYFSLSPVNVKGRIVYRETPFSGTARPGDLLLVRLTAAGATEWRYLMIEDPIPAGTESIRQDGLYEMERPREWLWGSQREYRDDRVVVFQERFDKGRYEFSHLLKVVTPGVFRAMPARISAMYIPDATASSEIQAVTVETPRPARSGGGQ
jgi:uncharacterized protein YfaS (alpha-2-macroglobulin family)